MKTAPPPAPAPSRCIESHAIRLQPLSLLVISGAAELLIRVYVLARSHTPLHAYHSPFPQILSTVDCCWYTQHPTVFAYSVTVLQISYTQRLSLFINHNYYMLLFTLHILQIVICNLNDGREFRAGGADSHAVQR